MACSDAPPQVRERWCNESTTMLRRPRFAHPSPHQRDVAGRSHRKNAQPNSCGSHALTSAAVHYRQCNSGPRSR
eukprot:4097043-Pleurochrysis_carterae.AAC.1